MSERELLERYRRLDHDGRMMVERALITELRRMAVEYQPRPQTTVVQGTIIHFQNWGGYRNDR